MGSNTALVTKGPGKDPNFRMTIQDYEESLGRVMGQKGVRGVAVTSHDAEVTYYNNSIPPKILHTFTKATLNSEYLCTLMCRRNDPLSRLVYIRVETDKYEVVASVEKTHLALMYCDGVESYNGDNLLDAEGMEED